MLSLAPPEMDTSPIMAALAAAPTASATPPRTACPATQHLKALTGARFLAAVLVVAYHFLRVPVAPEPGPLHVATQALNNLISSGFTGVSFFFILSGFILAYTYVVPTRGLRVTPRRFWLARVARLYPIYLLALVVAFIPYLGWGASSAQSCLGTPVSAAPHHAAVTGGAAIFMVQAWLPCAMRWNPPAWSLSAEAFFYLLFPLIALGIARLRRRHLVGAAIGAWGVTLALSLAYLVLQPDAGVQAGWASRYWSWILYSDPLARLPEFVMGAALGRLFLERRVTSRPRNLLNPHVLAPLAAAAIVMTLCLDIVPDVFYKIVALDPLFALLVYSLAFGVGPLASLLSLPQMVLLGEASYAVYILHWPIHLWFGHIADALPLPASLWPPSRPAPFAVYLCIVLVAAVLSVRYVERPAQRALKKVFERWTSLPARTSVVGAPHTLYRANKAIAKCDDAMYPAGR